MPSTTGRLSIVTRADDAGSSLSANRAIREVCENGIVRNVSIMAVGPYLNDAFQQLGHLGDRVAFGLHACLNSEWDYPRWGPTLPQEIVPTLVEEDGKFTRVPMELKKREANIEQMLVEIESQLSHAREAGFAPVYLDEHMGVGWLPGLKEGLAEFARREGLKFFPSLRYLPLPTEKQLAFNSSAEALRQFAETLEGIYLLVGHPAHDDEEMRAITGPGIRPGQVAQERDRDRLMFTNPVFRDVLRGMAVRYDEL